MTYEAIMYYEYHIERKYKRQYISITKESLDSLHEAIIAHKQNGAKLTKVRNVTKNYYIYTN